MMTQIKLPNLSGAFGKGTTTTQEINEAINSRGLDSLSDENVDVKSKLEVLRGLLNEQGIDLEILKTSLGYIKKSIQADVHIVAELLPEDIGLLAEALMRTEQIRIVEEAQAKVRKSTKKKGPSAKQIISEIDENNLAF